MEGKVMKLGILLIATLLLAACAQTTDTVKIGFIGPLTGDAASLGQAARAGAEIAVDEVNAAGGIDGRPLEIIYEDGKCNGKDASTAASKLVNIDGVTFIVGGLCSGETLGIAPIMEANNVVSLSTCSSNPAVTDAGDYVFRAYPSDTFQGKYAAEYLYEQGYRKVAILSTLNEWAQGISPVFEKRFTELGGEIAGKETFETDARDMRTQITKLRDAEPDALYMLGMTEGSIVGIKQIHEMGWDVPVLGGDGWDDPAIADGIGTAGNGFEFVTVGTPLTDAFKQKMLEKTGDIDMPICAPQAYDIVHIYANLANAGADTPEKLKDALYAMAPYDGPSGTIAFDENGDLASAYYVVKHYEDGKIVA